MIPTRDFCDCVSIGPGASTVNNWGQPPDGQCPPHHSLDESFPKSYVFTVNDNAGK